MSEDGVVQEVRAAREAFAAAHGYDVRAMVAALRELDAGGGREVLRFAPRPVAPDGLTVAPEQPLQQSGAASSHSGNRSVPSGPGC